MAFDGYGCVRFCLRTFSLCLLLLTMAWMYDVMTKEVHVQENIHEMKRDIIRPQPIKNHSKDNLNLHKYLDPGPAGSGSYQEEILRMRRHLATQQAVCLDIRRIGGAKPKPGKASRDHDPDGAWEVCFDKEAALIPGKCIVYSFGIADEWSFDEGMENFGCHVFAFDPSMGVKDHQHSDGINFYNTGLSERNTDGVPGAEDRRGWKMRNLDTIFKELQHTKKIIDVLKMDIEWDEWKCLPQMLASVSLRRQVKQLNIEYHVVDYTAPGVRRYYGIMKWLERQGFLIFKKHKNYYCPECFEMSYINMNLVKLQTNGYLYKKIAD